MKTSLISWRGAIITLAALMSVFSIWLVHVDQNMTWRWVAFGLHLSSVVMIVIVSVMRSEIRELELKTRARSKTHLLLFLFIAAYTVLMNTLFLTTYPFVAEGDEVRDNGLQAMEIVKGIRKSIFEYGSYDGYGLIVPTLTSFFFRLFPGSVLVWRLLSIIVGTIAVFLVFFLMLHITSLNTAFWSAFILANLPLQLFYSRTETVVIFSSMLTVLLIMSVIHFLQYRSVSTLVVFSVLSGFSSNFHTSIRTIAVMLAGVMVILTTTTALMKYHAWWHRVLLAIGYTGTILFFFFVGFGPRILYSPPAIFFHRGRAASFAIFDSITFSSIQKDLQMVNERYRESLLVYGVRPTSFWYPDHRPILPGFLYPFFLVGILVALTKHRSIMWPVLVLAALIPLTNSAITEGVNFDHRLAPLFPISAIVTGIGITWFLKNIRQERWLWIVSNLAVAGSIVWMGVSFFVNQPAVKDKTIRQYVSMHLVTYLVARRERIPTLTYCIYGHPDIVDLLNIAHIREQYAYFVPGFSYETKQDTLMNLRPNELYLSRSCMETAQKTLLYQIPCSKGKIMKSFFCPAHNEQYPDIRIWGEPGAFQ